MENILGIFKELIAWVKEFIATVKNFAAGFDVRYNFETAE